MFFGGDPFEQFPPGGRPGGAPSNVDTTKLYETLNVSWLMYLILLARLLLREFFSPEYDLFFLVIGGKIS